MSSLILCTTLIIIIMKNDKILKENLGLKLELECIKKHIEIYLRVVEENEQKSEYQDEWGRGWIAGEKQVLKHLLNTFDFK